MSEQEKVETVEIKLDAELVAEAEKYGVDIEQAVRERLKELCG